MNAHRKKIISIVSALVIFNPASLSAQDTNSSKTIDSRTDSALTLKTDRKSNPTAIDAKLMDPTSIDSKVDDLKVVDPKMMDPQNFSIQSCYTPGVARQAQCYRLQRPLFADSSKGKTITLGGIIVPSQAPAAANDPLIILVGGPGQSASDMTGPLLPLFNKIRNKRNIVFFDIRGTGKSSPLACDSFDDLPPLTQSPIEEVQTQMRACAEPKAEDIRSFTSMTAVADLEALRNALNAEKINLWGASYGTRLAQLYMRSHADRVRTAVLDGVVPFKPSYIQTQSAHATASLNTLVDDCRQSPDCAKAFPSFDPIALLDRVGALQDISYRHPVTGAITETRTSRTVVAQTIFSNLYKPQSRAFIPWILTQAVEHNQWGPMATLALDTGEYLGLKSLYSGAYFSIICSGEFRRNAREMESADASSPDYAFFKDLPRKQLNSICVNWPVSETPEELPPTDTATSEIPVLMISGALDPITPPKMADAIGDEFPNNRHIVIAKGGHINSDRSCVSEAILNFVNDPALSLETLDTEKVCESEVFSMPFVTSTLGAFVRDQDND